jgi:hypothetical protein
LYISIAGAIMAREAGEFVAMRLPLMSLYDFTGESAHATAVWPVSMPAMTKRTLSYFLSKSLRLPRYP